MRVIAAFAVVLTACGLFLAWRFRAAGRSRPAGTFLVTPQALLHYTGVVFAVVGALFCLLALAAAFG